MYMVRHAVTAICFIIVFVLAVAEAIPASFVIQYANNNGKIFEVLTEVEVTDNNIAKYGKSIAGDEGKQVVVLPVIVDGKILPPHRLPPIGTTAADLKLLCFFLGDRATYGRKELTLDHFNSSIGVWRSTDNRFYNVDVTTRSGNAQYAINEVKQ